MQRHQERLVPCVTLGDGEFDALYSFIKNSKNIFKRHDITKKFRQRFLVKRELKNKKTKNELQLERLTKSLRDIIVYLNKRKLKKKKKDNAREILVK